MKIIHYFSKLFTSLLSGDEVPELLPLGQALGQEVPELLLLGQPAPAPAQLGAARSTYQQHFFGILGNSGIKFELEGGEGSTGADTYIPLQKSFILASFCTEICDFAAFF